MNEQQQKLSDRFKTIKYYEILRTMVKSLRRPHTEIDMGSYGHRRGDRCYGCAATNCILELGGDKNWLRGAYNSGFEESLVEGITDFEFKVDELRYGSLSNLDDELPQPKIDLISITDYNYNDEEVLQTFLAYADQLEKLDL